jgi:hypothetical protein
MCSELMPRVLTREYFECRIQVVSQGFGGGMLKARLVRLQS